MNTQPSVENLAGYSHNGLINLTADLGVIELITQAGDSWVGGEMMISMPSGTMVPNTNESWLVLMDYSTKYKVSVSTLRRRIKAEDIKFRLEDGKYYIIDEPMSTHQRGHRPSPESELAQVGTHQENQQAPNSFSAKQDISDKIAMAKNDEPILTAANKLLTELKKAYTQILQEKEEQMLMLKDEVADLKTLVRVLESDNERLRSFKQ